MKKQVLVSVDRGETRVALLEATGTVAARKPGSGVRAGGVRPPSPRAGYQVAELYLERRGARSIVGNIYKGRVDNVLAGLEAAFVDIGLEKNGFLHVDEIVLPGRRGAAPRPRRRPGRAADHRHAQARPGDRRPGGQGPAEDQGRAAVDGPDDRRALHGLRPVRRGRRRLAPARRQGARAAAQGGGQARPEGRRRDHPHRRPGRQARRPRARAAVPVQARRGAPEARRRDAGAGARLPGGRPLGARRARHLLRGVRARDRRRPQAAPPAGLVLLAHRARARRPRRAVGGGAAAVRGLRGRGGARLDARRAGSTCPAAAT